eukprot:gene12271-25795_t
MMVGGGECVRQRYGQKILSHALTIIASLKAFDAKFRKKREMLYILFYIRIFIFGIKDPTKSAAGCYAGGTYFQDYFSFVSNSMQLFSLTTKAGIYIATMFLSIAYWVYFVRIKEPAERNLNATLPSNTATTKYGTL